MFLRDPLAPGSTPTSGVCFLPVSDGDREEVALPSCGSDRWWLWSDRELQEGRNKRLPFAESNHGFPGRASKRIHLAPNSESSLSLKVKAGPGLPPAAPGRARPRRAASRSPHCSTLSSPPVTCTLSRAHLSLHPATQRSAARWAAGPRQARRPFLTPPSPHAWGSSGAQWTLKHD